MILSEVVELTICLVCRVLADSLVKVAHIARNEFVERQKIVQIDALRVEAIATSFSNAGPGMSSNKSYQIVVVFTFEHHSFQLRALEAADPIR